MMAGDRPSSAVRRPHVIFLVGPTAAGKTAVAIRLAEQMHGEIISLDSRTFYRGMDIGTAKPTHEDRARVPHHLVDIASPNQVIGLAELQWMANDSIAAILGRGRLPILVGGTGQYIRALASGWTPPEVAPDERLRTELARLASTRGPDWLHARLQGMDPDAASAINANNLRRSIRALEVIFATGRRFSEQKGRAVPQHDPIMIGLKRSRQDLYARIDARIEEMWSKGLLDETRRLLESGVRADAPAMSAIGYGQCVRVLRGEMDAEQAKSEMRRATRIFVRRQAGWFRDEDPAIRWFDASMPDVVESIEAYIRARMDAYPRDSPGDAFRETSV